MCTYATVKTELEGSAKGPDSRWFHVTDGTVYFDHPVHAMAEHTLNIDFTALAKGPWARVAVELTADTLAARSFLAGLLSAVAAGAIMTVFTWITTASEGAAGQIVVALLVGFLLSAPILNHAVVGFGEMFFGLVAGTTHAAWSDLAANVGIAVLGNLIEGVGIVFTTRLAQVGGNPDDGSSESKARRAS